jgi:hypothetical protein
MKTSRHFGGMYLFNRAGKLLVCKNHIWYLLEMHFTSNIPEKDI